MEEKVRLNKYLGTRGICSRRAADQWIAEGRVEVNGAPADLGMKVSDEDEIRIDGKPVPKDVPDRVVIALNKPAGYVCTTRRFENEKNVLELVPSKTRLYPVGRLDKASEGLLFLTNDGDFAREMTDASARHEKEYRVVTDRAVAEEHLKKMAKGVYLEALSKTTSPCRIEKTGEREFRIVLVQGLNRQIRRMCEAFGYGVATLRRIRIGTVTLGGLAEGGFRELAETEKESLLHGRERTND